MPEKINPASPEAVKLLMLSVSNPKHAMAEIVMIVKAMYFIALQNK